MEKKIIQQLIQSLSEILPQEPSIAVSDQNHYLLYKPSKNIDLKILPGEQLKPGSVSELAVRERHRVMSFVPADVFGVPYFGLGTPIFDEEGQPIGAITLILPPEQANLLRPMPRHEFLVGQKDDQFYPVHHEQVVFFTSENGQTFMHTMQEQYRIRRTLQELEWSLPANRFVRCHRAFLVNVSYIQEIHRDFHSTFLLVMKDHQQTRIPVSQKYTSAFRRALGF